MGMIKFLPSHVIPDLLAPESWVIPMYYSIQLTSTKNTWRVTLVSCSVATPVKANINPQVVNLGHNHLLEIWLLEKSARHNFIIARHRSSNNIFSCQLLENQKSWKIICRTCILSSFTFRQKTINCSNCKWSTKVLENVNCSTQFIVKKLVYMYGS